MAELIHVRSPRLAVSDFGEIGIQTSPMLQESHLNPPCPKTRTAPARNKERSLVFLFILPYPFEETKKLNRRAKTSIDSESTTTLKSGNWTKCIFSKIKWGFGYVLAERKLPQNLLSLLWQGPPAPVFSSPWKTSIQFRPPPQVHHHLSVFLPSHFPEQNQMNISESSRPPVSREEIYKDKHFSRFPTHYCGPCC